MTNLVLVFVTAALVYVDCNIIGPQSSNLNNDLDNSIDSQAPRTKSRGSMNRWRFRIFRIAEHPPESVQHEPGTVLDLKCAVNAKPAPFVQWYKNGNPIEEYDETNEIIPVQPSSLGLLVSHLLISSPSPNPEDSYTCVATSGLRKTEFSTTVYTPQDTFEPLELSPYQMPTGPRIVSYYTALFQNTGTEVILPCKVNAHPKALVYWTHNDNLVEGNSRFKVLSSGDLYISSLRWADMGVFTCTAKNAFGEETVETFVYPTKPA